MGNMTCPEDAEYIGILETVIAVLAVKLGMHPEVTMANAIREISAQAGLETFDSDALIQARWSGRNVSQIVRVAGLVSNVSLSDVRGVKNENTDLPSDHEGHLTMAERMQNRRQRKLEQK